MRGTCQGTRRSVIASLWAVIVSFAVVVGMAAPAAAWPTVPNMVLTSSNGGRVILNSDGVSTWARANATGTDARVVWADTGLPAMVDQQVCATWQSFGRGVAQPGVALRIRSDGGRVRAITVTNNVVFGLRYGFNVHVWDTAVHTPSGDAVVHQIGGLNLRDAFYPNNRYAPLPWRMCARIRGQRLDVKVWPTRDGLASWGDHRYSATFTVPANFVYAGRPGWYAGHLHHGDAIAQTNQAAGPVSRREDVVPTPIGRQPRP